MRIFIFFILLFYQNNAWSVDLMAEQAKLWQEVEEFSIRNISIGKPIDNYINFSKKNKLEVSKKALKLQIDHFAKAQVRKKTCSDKINIRAPLSLQNPRNQDSENWCFGFTTADLIAHATGELPSAAQMSLLAPEYIRSPGDGYVGRFLASAKRMGYCLERDLPSDNYDFWKTKKYDISKFKAHLEEFAKIQKNQSPEQIAMALCQHDRLNAAVSEIFPSQSFMELAQIVAKAEEQELLREWVKKSCATKISSALNQLQIKYVDRPKPGNWKDIDRQFDAGNIVGIEFDSGMLKDHHAGIDVFNGHAVSLVGRRFNPATQSCEYLLRNSWGKECKDYSTNYECKDGHIWIDEAYFQFNNFIRRAVYLEKSNAK